MPVQRSAANALRSATTRVDVSAATAPSNGQVLTATSSTAATWQTPSGSAWSVLADVNLGSAASTLSSGTITAKTRLRITIMTPGFSSNDIPRIQFNGDTASNYRHEVSVDGASTTVTASAPGINMDTTNRSNVTLIIMDVYNAGGDGFVVRGQSYLPGILIDFGGRHNTTANITSVTLRGVGGANLQSGTRMIIEGAT